MLEIDSTKFRENLGKFAEKLIAPPSATGITFILLLKQLISDGSINKSSRDAFE